MLRFGDFARFVVQAKKPSLDLVANRRAIFQGKRYKSETNGTRPNEAFTVVASVLRFVIR